MTPAFFPWTSVGGVATWHPNWSAASPEMPEMRCGCEIPIKKPHGIPTAVLPRNAACTRRTRAASHTCWRAATPGVGSRRLCDHMASLECCLPGRIHQVHKALSPPTFTPAGALPHQFSYTSIRTRCRSTAAHAPRVVAAAAHSPDLCCRCCATRHISKWLL